MLKTIITPLQFSPTKREKVKGFKKQGFILGLFHILGSPFLCSILIAGHPITIDGQFQDWDNVDVAYADGQADGMSADFANIKITYDMDFLFIYFNFHSGEYLLQDNNAFHLYIDSDHNPETGLEKNGIGAELHWVFGQRQGTWHSNGSQISIWQNDITLRTGPTITSNEFEIAVSRYCNVFGGEIVEGNLIIEEAPPNSDTVPNESGGIYFSLGEDAVPYPEPIPFERRYENDIRILSYNTLYTGIVEPDRQPHFERIIKAIDPDVIALQEHSEWDEIETIIQSWFPDDNWTASWTYRDLVVLSRFPIMNDANLISSERTMCALLDTENELGHNLLMMNSHLSCCDNDETRQQQVDEFASIWRDWRLGGNGPFSLEMETPFIHVGDFNFVGQNQQVKTLRDGDILDENTYGADYLPDWDESPIIDLFSRHTEKRMGYTWRSDGSSFNPGKLDYIFYSDATIDSGRHFVVNTLAMSPESLAENGLEWNDTQEASDHLPRVFDLSLDPNVGINIENSISTHFAILNNYPNPFNPTTTINIMVESLQATSLIVYNIKGRLVDLIFQGELETGSHEFQWNGTHYSSGVYFIKMQSGDYVKTHKMILLK